MFDVFRKFGTALDSIFIVCFHLQISCSLHCTFPFVVYMIEATPNIYFCIPVCSHWCVVVGWHVPSHCCLKREQLTAAFVIIGLQSLFFVVLRHQLVIQSPQLFLLFFRLLCFWPASLLSRFLLGVCRCWHYRSGHSIRTSTFR